LLADYLCVLAFWEECFHNAIRNINFNNLNKTISEEGEEEEDVGKEYNEEEEKEDIQL
jgi:hypothetical protein